MNIAFSVDSNYLPYCSVAIQSIIQNHNSNNNLKFYISHFPDVLNIEKILDQIKLYGHDAVSLPVEYKYVESFPTRAHISSTTYLRLLLPELLPITVKKILYLDCDLIVMSDLSELFHQDLEHYSTAMISELGNKSSDNLREEYNAGVMLMDINKWRDKGISKKIIEYIMTHESILKWMDQTAINNTIWNDVKKLDIKWNMITPYFTDNHINYSDVEKELIKNAKADTRIVHFTTASKPWDYINNHPYRQKFLDYLKETPFSQIKLSKKNTKTILKKFRRMIRSKLYKDLKKNFKI